MSKNTNDLFGSKEYVIICGCDCGREVARLKRTYPPREMEFSDMYVTGHEPEKPKGLFRPDVRRRAEILAQAAHAMRPVFQHIDLAGALLDRERPGKMRKGR